MKTVSSRPDVLSRPSKRAHELVPEEGDDDDDDDGDDDDDDDDDDGDEVLFEEDSVVSKVEASEDETAAPMEKGRAAFSPSALLKALNIVACVWTRNEQERQKRSEPRTTDYLRRVPSTSECELLLQQH